MYAYYILIINEKVLLSNLYTEKKMLLNQKHFFPKACKGFSNRDITISYLYMNAPLNFFNELSMSKR